MIGRLEILLPYDLYVPAEEQVSPIRRTREGCVIDVFPAVQTSVDRSILSLKSQEALASIFDGFNERTVPAANDSVSYGSVPTIMVDLLRADVHLADEFERSQGAAEGLRALALREANTVLSHLRALGRSPHVRPITDRDTSRFRFLRDDGSEYEPAPPLVSRVRTYGHPADVLVVPSALWEAARELPDSYEISAWDYLVLDATALLPDVGPAMVLAYAALEARITSALDLLARAKAVDQTMWAWLNDRDDHAKQPSIRERFDVMLKWLTGKTLKDETDLWQSFMRLREARNSFAHTGIVAVGKLREPVTHEDSLKLVAAADRIIEWVDELLPEPHRRPRFTTPTLPLRITRRVVGNRVEQLEVDGLALNARTPTKRTSGAVPSS